MNETVFYDLLAGAGVILVIGGLWAWAGWPVAVTVIGALAVAAGLFGALRAGARR